MLKKYSSDVESIDAIIKAYYEAVCHEAGEERDWERDKALHHPHASITILNEMESPPKVQSLVEYQANRKKQISPTGFYEHELNRITQQHGHIAHVWSTYETKFTKNGPVSNIGINSIQLVCDKDRWYIMHWMFDGRKHAPSVDKKYMLNSK